MRGGRKRKGVERQSEDSCHMRRRIHVIWGGGRERKGVERQSEDSCHMRRRIHVIWGGGRERKEVERQSEYYNRGMREKVSNITHFEHLHTYIAHFSNTIDPSIVYCKWVMYYVFGADFSATREGWTQRNLSQQWQSSSSYDMYPPPPHMTWTGRRLSQQWVESIWHVSSSAYDMYPPPPHMTWTERTLSQQWVESIWHVSSSAYDMYPPPPRMTWTERTLSQQWVERECCHENG